MPSSENSSLIMFYYVYILESLKSKNLYIDYTGDLRKRLKEHFYNN